MHSKTKDTRTLRNDVIWRKNISKVILIYISQYFIKLLIQAIILPFFPNRPIFGFTREPFLAEAQTQGSPGSGLPDIITQATLKCFYCLWNNFNHLLVEKSNVTTYTYTIYIYVMCIYFKHWKPIWKIWLSSIANWPLLSCCFG